MTKEPIGSVAEEAAKLFAVLQHAAVDSRDTTSAGDAAQDDVREDYAAGAQDGDSGVRRDHVEDDSHEHEHGIGRGPECQWCPVCQLINKVRNTSPETIEQLSTAAAHVLGSVRSLLEAAAEAAREAREDAASRPDEQEEPSRSRVDRIDVSEDPEPWD
jgi:hypothetical protein